jgi:hypothetical protein
VVTNKLFGTPEWVHAKNSSCHTPIKLATLISTHNSSVAWTLGPLDPAQSLGDPTLQLALHTLDAALLPSWLSSILALFFLCETKV